MDTKKMLACAQLLPEPGDKVVVECLDEIERLRAELAALKQKGEPLAWMNKSGSNIISTEAKERLIEKSGLGGEFSVAAKTAERYTVPLYTQPVGNAELASIRNIVRDDAYAITFQSLAQYRTALLKAIDAAIAKAEGGK